MQSFFDALKDKQNRNFLLTIAFIIIFVVIPFRVFVAQPFVVDGDSMYPTLKNADYLVVDQISYRFSDPKRGDVVVFRYPHNPSESYVKRIIGLPGETVQIQKGVVSVKTKAGESITLSEPYIVSEDATYNIDTILDDEEYFVMGDNRPRSSDSRIWGPLPRENIQGRPLLRVWPFWNAAWYPGQFTL